MFVVFYHYCDVIRKEEPRINAVGQQDKLFRLHYIYSFSGSTAAAGWKILRYTVICVFSRGQGPREIQQIRLLTHQKQQQCHIPSECRLWAEQSGATGKTSWFADLSFWNNWAVMRNSFFWWMNDSWLSISDTLLLAAGSASAWFWPLIGCSGQHLEADGLVDVLHSELFEEAFVLTPEQPDVRDAVQDHGQSLQA